MLAPAIAKTNLKSYDVPRFGRMEFGRLVVRGAGYLRGESLAARGHTVALCSSALTIHARPVARFLGITHVLCVHFTVDYAGLLTGNIVRPIGWGPTKAAAVQNFCTDNAVTLDDRYFYADGDEDAALMALVGHPRPVNPRPRLAAVAGQRSWPVLRVTGSGGRPRVRSMLRKGA